MRAEWGRSGKRNPGALPRLVGRRATPIQILISMTSGSRPALPAEAWGDADCVKVWPTNFVSALGRPVGPELGQQSRIAFTELDKLTSRFLVGQAFLPAQCPPRQMRAGSRIFPRMREAWWPRPQSSTNQLNDKLDASPAVAGNELFPRGRETLQCIANE